MRINRFSYLCLSVLDQVHKFFCLCFLIDLPAIVSSADSNLTAIICIKCPVCSHCIIFNRQFTDIRLYLIFVKSVETVFVCCEQIFYHFSVYCLCTVIEIIGNDHICKFIDQIAVFDQSCIILINGRLFIASIRFQINRCSSREKRLQNILVCHFCFQGSSLFFRNNNKLVSSLFKMGVRWCCHITLLHTLQSGNCSINFLIVIFYG